MIDPALASELAAITGPGSVRTSDVDRMAYSYDATADVPRALPDVVVLPESREQVTAVVDLARSHRIPIYPRGSGTNLSGGTIPLQGGIVMSFQKMNRILEIDVANLTATVQPGVVIQDLNDAVARFGLIYPPDPGTVATATMGGSAAENSGGLRGLKYGVTKHYVLGMEVVLANGERVRFGGKTVKNVTAYDFSSLFVGSEGTLGIITELTVKLIPAPKHRRSLLATFDTLEAAGNTVAGIIASKVIPATLEIMDRTTLQAVEAFSGCGLPTTAAALLLIEVDGMSEPVVEAEFEAVVEAIRRQSGTFRTAATDAERDQLWKARRSALPALASLNNTVVIEDATVPRSRITEMLLACEAIAQSHGITIGTFGHAGDGNLHPTLLYDRRDPDETARVHRAIDAIFETALGLGGTLSGEHGIGIAKLKYLESELGQAGLGLMRSLKQALDPWAILNPGKLVPAQERP